MKTLIEIRRGNRAWLVERNKKALAAKRAQPCTDCGMTFPPYITQLDHIRGERLNGKCISRHLGRSGVRFDSELAKCDTVCANCHAARTYFRAIEAEEMEREL